jgi:hypothetical protein
VLGTLLLVLQESAGPGVPAACLRDVSAGAEVECQPERAPRGPPGIAALGMALVRTLQRPQAVLHVAQEQGRGRQQFQILGCQGRGAVGQ